MLLLKDHSKPREPDEIAMPINKARQIYTYIDENGIPFHSYVSSLQRLEFFNGGSVVGYGCGVPDIEGRPYAQNKKGFLTKDTSQFHLT